MVESHQRQHLKADKTIAGQPGRQEFSTRAPQRSRIPSMLGSLARIVRLLSRLEVTFVSLYSPLSVHYLSVYLSICPSAHPSICPSM